MQSKSVHIYATQMRTSFRRPKELLVLVMRSYGTLKRRLIIEPVLDLGYSQLTKNPLSYKKNLFEKYKLTKKLCQIM
jgi:hypothetical protein